jgi:hypothetical protein
MISSMSMTASEMSKRSAVARRKKHGGKKGFSAHMSAVRRAALDKKAIHTRTKSHA